MSDKNSKELRKQLRNVIQAEVPNLVTQELYLKLLKEMNAHINRMATHINDRLNVVDEKQKDFHAYIVRQLSDINPVKPEQPKSE